MTYAEVKELLQAGFTHDEIMSLTSPQDPGQKAAQPEQTNNQPEQEPTQSNPDKDPATEQSETGTTGQQDVLAELRTLFSSLKDSNNQLIRTIQASNLDNNTVQTMNDIDSKVDNIFASIIRAPDDGKE